jgi:hypothetical protein
LSSISAAIQAVCRKRRRDVNAILGQTGAREISVKNYMSSEQITKEAAATTQTRKRKGICVGQRFCLGSVTKSLNTNSKSTFKAPNGAV